MATTVVGYTYRADGMRVLKSPSLVPVEENGAQQGGAGEGMEPTPIAVGTYYRYDGQMLMEDKDTALSKVTRYGLGARGVDYVASTTASGTSEGYPVYDAHGNMVATLARSGGGYVVSNRRAYDAWGGIRQGATSGDPKGRYCASIGHVQDDESGLVYMRARYYEPASGRFISEDPRQMGENWFAYGDNCPTGRVDYSGQSADWEDGFLFILGSLLANWGQKLLRSGFKEVCIAAGELRAAGFAEKVFGGFLAVEAQRRMSNAVKTIFAGAFLAAAGAILMALGVEGKEYADGFLKGLEQFKEFKDWYDAYKNAGG